MVKRLALGAVALLVVLIGIGAVVTFEPDIPRTVLEAKYAAPPSRFLTLSDGTRVHHRDHDPREAQVLILLHGSDSSLFDWEAWSKILSSPPPKLDDQGANPIQGATVVGKSPAATGPLDLDLKGGSYVLLEVTADGKSVDLQKKVAAAIAQIRSRLGCFRVISVDLPGHGLTGAVRSGDYSEAGMVKFVEAFADKLGIKQFALAGNSMGGGVAARFAETYPDRVTHLIIVDGYAAGMSEGDRLPLAYRLARIPVLNRILLKLTPRFVVEEGLNKAVARKAILTNDMIDRFWDFLRMEGTRPATLVRFNLKGDNFVRDHARAITAPTLILWGAEDHMLPVADARVWVRAIPGSRLIVYPATGHMPMEEVPEKSAGDVRAFLEQRLHYEIRVNDTSIDPGRVTRASAQPRMP